MRTPRSALAALAPLLLPALLGLAPGCVLLSADEIDARKDIDGDGVLLDEDCDDADPAVGRPQAYALDRDGDGFAGPEERLACAPPASATAQAGDCDDSNPLIFPGAPDAPYDGLDADCAGEDADGDGVPDDYDQDGDGAAAAPVGEDCDDLDPLIAPGAAEACDGVDNDCDGLLDADDPDLDASAYVVVYPDLDGDGFGPSALGEAVCTPPAGAALAGGDCDDGAAAVYPGAVEGCDGLDNDCDGLVDLDDPDADVASAPEWYDDRDADGYGAGPGLGRACEPPVAGAAPRDGDCDDGLPGVNPSAIEVCNGLDDDCDGLADDDDPSVDLGAEEGYFFDGDGDGYGAVSLSVTSCVPPAGAVALGGDCNDGLTTVRPGAPDLWYDGVDSDCADNDDFDRDADGVVRSADVGRTTSYGAGSASSFGGALPGGDCNDTLSTVHPGAADAWYDGVDSDCAGNDDYDADLDNYVPSAYVGRTTGYGAGVAASFGGLMLGGDCDDARPTVSPSATEVCDGGVDNDCDSLADDADPSLSWATGTTAYRDADGDSYGDASVTTRACLVPAGYTNNALDCDDGAFAVRPGATEVCDELDNDCDTLIDDADPGVSAPTVLYFTDGDGDGYGLSGTGLGSATCAAPPGRSALSGDCDDGYAARSPGAPEVCDRQDNDCDGLIDDDDRLSTGAGTLTYTDDDGDGYGDELDGSPVAYCVVPAGRADTADDCDDSEPAIHPGEAELENGIDDDCDDYVDEGGFLGAGSLIYTEIMYRGAATLIDTNSEWVELHNPGSIDVVVGPGWTMSEAGSALVWTAATAFTVPAGGYALVVKTTAATNGGIPVVLGQYGLYTAMALNNTGGDTLTLSYDDPDLAGGAVTVDTVTYLINSGGWPSSATAQGRALQLSYVITPAPLGYPADNALAANWCATLNTAAYLFGATTQYGTPGAVNADCTP